MTLDFFFTSAQWFELIKTLTTGVIAVYIGYRLALQSKSKEIRLASYYKERIEAVRVLYGLITALQDADRDLFSSEEWDQRTHTQYKADLIDWLNSFEQFYEHYNKNRILLIEKTKISIQIRNKLRQLSKLRVLISIALLELTDLEEKYMQDDLHGSYYKDLVDENNKVNAQAAKLLQSVTSRVDENLFETLRIDLETYFKKLTS